MTPRDDPLLNSAVERAVSAFSDEARALKVAGERRIAAEIWLVVTRRRSEACWPHRTRTVLRERQH